MHYKNGRPAKIGDQILFADHLNTLHAGVVIEVNEGATTCNLTVVHLMPGVTYSATSSRCVHVEDIANPIPFTPIEQAPE